MKDAAVAATDGYEGARPEGSCSNDFGFGCRGNRSIGPTRIIDFHHVRAPQVDGTLDPQRAAHRYSPGSTTTTAPPKDAATARASAMLLNGNLPLSSPPGPASSSTWMT